MIRSTTTIRLKYAAQFKALVGFGVALVCVGGVQTGRGQNANAGQAAEQGRQLTIKSDVRIVLVDVVVTGAKGLPAAGLEREDFHISEDGKAQVVSFFE